MDYRRSCLFKSALNRCTVSAFYNSLILLTYQSWKAAVKVGIHISEKKIIWNVQGAVRQVEKWYLKTKVHGPHFFLMGSSDFSLVTKKIS